MLKPLASLGLGATLLALLCLDAGAQQRKRVPRFSDYPVKEIYQGKTAAPILETDDQRLGSTYYQAVADGGVNFAGHYAVVMLGCGAGCSSIEFLDTRTGQITSGDFTNSGWKKFHDAFRDVEFRRNSRLIVFAGSIDQKGPAGWHFYLFDNGKLKRLHTIVTKGDFSKPLLDWMK